MAGLLSKPIPIAHEDDRESRDYSYLGTRLGVRLVNNNKGPRLQIRRFYMEYDKNGVKKDEDDNPIYMIGSCVSLTLLELSLLSDNISFLIEAVKGCDQFGSGTPVITARPQRGLDVASGPPIARRHTNSLDVTSGYKGPPYRARRTTIGFDVTDGDEHNKENVTPPGYNKKTQHGSRKYADVCAGTNRFVVPGPPVKNESGSSGYGSGQGSNRGSVSDLVLGIKSQEDMPPLVFHTDEQEDGLDEDGAYFQPYGNHRR